LRERLHDLAGVLYFYDVPLKPIYRLSGFVGAGSLGARFGKFGVPGPGTSTGFL